MATDRSTTVTPQDDSWIGKAATQDRRTIAKLSMLEHIVDKNGVYPDPEKVRAVQEFPRPIDVKFIQFHWTMFLLPKIHS